MYKWILTLVLLASSSTPASSAAIYKCVGTDGHTTFSQSRCARNAETISIRPEFTGKTNSPDTGLRKGETKTLKSINRREKKRAAKRKKQAQKATTSVSAGKSRCEAAKKQIKQAQEQRRNGCSRRKCDQIDENIHRHREQKNLHCH